MVELNVSGMRKTRKVAQTSLAADRQIGIRNESWRGKVNWMLILTVTRDLGPRQMQLVEVTMMIARYTKLMLRNGCG